MKGRIVLALSLVVACKHAAPQTVPPPVMDPGPSNPPGPIVVTPLPTSSKLRFGPSATRYVIQQRVRFEHDRPDMPPVTELGWRTFIASTITGPAESAGYPASFTVDSILPDSGVVLPPWMDLNAGRGLRFNGHLAPTG